LKKAIPARHNLLRAVVVYEQVLLGNFSSIKNKKSQTKLLGF
jgi:hypothetical protein